MRDLISRSALLEYAHNHVNCTVDCNDIARFPSIEAAPVRHGVWVEKGMSPNMLSVWECSECNLKLDGKTWPYCPNCGARMDVEVT